MKNIIQKIFLVIGSLLIFVITLEGVSFLLIKFRKPQFRNLAPRLGEEIWDFADVRRHSTSDSRVGEIARIIIQGKYEERNPVVNLSPEDMKLKMEPPDYPLSDRGNNIHYKHFSVTPNLNDEFQLVGLNTRKVKYKVHYTTDDTGMRKAFPGKTKNLLFLGCSYTFGQGLNDEETFPYLIGKKTGYRTFNKGIPGSGPLTILKHIRDSRQKYFKNIPEEETTVVLTLIPEHFPRVFNTISYLRTIGHKVGHPYLVVEENNFVIKTRYEDDPFGVHLFELYLSKMLFPIAFGIEYPLYGEKEYRLFTQILVEIQKELKMNFPQVKHFAVALFPTGSARKLYKDLREVITKEKNLTVFDYTSLNGPALFGNSFHLKYDGHPTPFANELYSDLLIYDLRKSFGI